MYGYWEMGDGHARTRIPVYGGRMYVYVYAGLFTGILVAGLLHAAGMRYDQAPRPCSGFQRYRFLLKPCLLTHLQLAPSASHSAVRGFLPRIRVYARHQPGKPGHKHTCASCRTSTSSSSA